MFNSKIKMISKRPGERWSSSSENLSKSIKDLNFKTKYTLDSYISDFVKKNKTN